MWKTIDDIDEKISTIAESKLQVKKGSRGFIKQLRFPLVTRTMRLIINVLF